MTFASIPTGEFVFVDANVFLYYFCSDPHYAAACDQLLQRIENQDLRGFTSAHVLSEVAHRLMTIEAHQTFGWPMAGMPRRLRRHPAQVRTLNRHRQAIDEIGLIRVQILPVSGPQVSRAADLSVHHGLLSGDGLVVIVMRDRGLTLLASHDADFDRVPNITRYAPA